MKLKNRFQRKETKYVLTVEQYTYLKKAFAKEMVLDQYGKHTILSLYYDDSNFNLIRRSIQKPKYKEKFRVRSYGVAYDPQTPVYLEIKKKVAGIVYKRRIGIPYEKLAAFNQHTASVVVAPKDQQVKNEIDYLMNRRHLFPRVLICYDREAFYGQRNADFRVTFDHQIRYRTTDLTLDSSSEGELVAPEVDVLMEVKALGAYPVWFTHLLSCGKIYPASFSKYAQVYQRYLKPKQMKKSA